MLDGAAAVGLRELVYAVSMEAVRGKLLIEGEMQRRTGWCERGGVKEEAFSRMGLIEGKGKCVSEGEYKKG